MLADNVISLDPFRAAHDLAHRFDGDVISVPLTDDGDIDLAHLDEHGALYTPGQSPESLGILVENFRRWFPDAPRGVTVVALPDGTAVQWRGPAFSEGVDALRDSIRCGRGMQDRRPTVMSFDDAIARIRDVRPNLSEKAAERIAEREIKSRIAEPAQKPADPVSGSASDLPYVCPAAWQGMAVPQRAWWLPDLIPMRQVTIINGDGGVGKSLLALQLGVAGALGIETLGTCPMPGRVMYLGAEDEESEFHRRTADIVRTHDRKLSDLGDFMLLPLADANALLSTPSREGVMQPTALWAKFSDDVLDFQPKLLVLDTAADLFGGDEIKRNQTRQFIAMLRNLAIKADCAVVLLAHPSVEGMKSGTGSSGSTAWNNSVRSRLYLTDAEKNEDPDLRILTTMKANYGKKGDKLRLRYSDGAFVLDDGMVDPVMMGMVHRKHDEKFVELLSKMSRLGQTVSPNPSQSYAPKVFAQHPDGKGVTKAHYQEAMHRLLDAGTIKIVEEGPNSRRYKRLYVAADMFGGAAA